MLNVYLRNPQTDAGAWLNFPASYQTVQHMLKALDILQKLWYCVVLTGEMIIRKVYLNPEKWRKGEEK